MRWLTLLLFACSGAPTDEVDETQLPDPGTEPTTQGPEPSLRRLTLDQYQRSIRSIFGDDIALPSILAEDIERDGLLTLGASVVTTSPLGVERYETAALNIADQLFAGDIPSPLPCTPTGPTDTNCATQYLEQTGRRIYRRPLESDELAALTDVITSVGAATNSFNDGAEYATAAMLQSPYFIYRVEQGDGSELDAFELATRLSFFLWNQPPDDTLLDAAANGVLDTPDGLAEEVDRLLADGRARDGIRAFFNELYELYHLDHINKDPTIYTHADPLLWEAAKEQTLRDIETHVFDRDADYRGLFTTRETHIDRYLATLYGVQAPSLDEMVPMTLPPEANRIGLLGHASMLALHSHSNATSPTLRGHFVRTRVLCQEIPPAPADVDTTLPESGADYPTMRDRLTEHRANPTCAACHNFTDPIGLALENYDGSGRYRATENDATIDPSGDLDGAAFTDANGLGKALSEHHLLGPCLTDTLFSYSIGQPPSTSQAEAVDWLSDTFAYNDFKVQTLLRTIALSDAFQSTGATQ